MTAGALADVAHTARTRGLPFILVGATARDVILWHVYGVPTSRGTRDLDFAFAVRDWRQFEDLVAALLDTGRFARVSGKPHQLHYLAASGEHALPVDILPFGGVEAADGRVAWPPTGEVQLDMVGFDDACRTALNAVIRQGTEVPVVSPPLLSALKIFAWKDRRKRQASKDAEDLMELLLCYERVGNASRLSGGDAYPMLEAAEFDMEEAGAQLLGYDLARAASRRIVNEVQMLLEEQGAQDELILRMAASSALRGRSDRVTLARTLLDRYVLGLRAGVTP